MYAGDTSITFASNNMHEINECVNSDLNNIHVWLSANKLTLNMPKPNFYLLARDKGFVILPKVQISL